MPRGSGSKSRGSSGTRATKASSGSGGKASSSGATKASSSTPKASSSSSAKTSSYGAQTSSSATKASHSEIDDLVRGTEKITLEDSSSEYLYRVCRKDEDISKDIVAKAKQGTPDAKRTVNQHINSGSKKDSSYISTTASPETAQQWAHYTKENPKDVREREEPLRIIKIDQSKMDSTCKPIDLTKESEREKYVSGATQINRAKSSQEVLFQDRIPKQNSRGENVFEEWKNPPKPEMPK